MEGLDLDFDGSSMNKLDKSITSHLDKMEGIEAILNQKSKKQEEMLKGLNSSRSATDSQQRDQI